MAKRVPIDQPFVWRAVVTRIYPSGAEYVTCCGPFTKKNHATGSATYEARTGDFRTRIDIQRAPLAWETVETRWKDHE